ncbi:MAG: HAD family phosphatase [Bacteroidales bacterium]|nr:HAD family phosphatase [Bacteroidales bacterium]
MESFNNQIKAIFWDNDGVLVDTEKYFFEATRQVLKKAGVNLTKELYIDLVLIQSKGAWHLLDQQEYSTEFVNNLREERDDLYQELLLTKEIRIEGVEDTVAVLAERYKMAVVTSSKPQHFYAIHSRTGLLKYFNFVITAADYARYKPDPEPYLIALERMGVSCDESIVIEDSRRGLMAAKKAGLECIIIPNEMTRTSDFSEADHVVCDIRELFQVL